MSEKSAKHSTFVTERNYKHSHARVIAAWAGQAAKPAGFLKLTSLTSGSADANSIVAARLGGQFSLSMPATRKSFRTGVLCIRTRWTWKTSGMSVCLKCRFHITHYNSEPVDIIKR